MTDRIFKAPCVKVVLGGIEAITFTMPVKDIVHLYYVAVRGQHDEEGAVQRPLSQQRIDGIRDYLLDGNTFFNSFILNWTQSPDKVTFSQNEISFPLIAAAAQAIDGQHRLAGFEAAMERNSSIGDTRVIVTMCIGLSTQEAATIFLNINTEQRPVPKSLLFDLFGETASDPNHAINRAKDIAVSLNDEEKSPLYRLIKFPSAARGVGKIELSTFVTAFKAALDVDGEFSQRKLRSLEHQKAVIFNYFDVLKDHYDAAEIWTKPSQNPIFKAAGFNGAVDFLLGKLIFKCAEEGDFSKKYIAQCMNLTEIDMLTWDDIKGLDGKTARKKVKEHFEQGLLRNVRAKDGYRF